MVAMYHYYYHNVSNKALDYGIIGEFFKYGYFGVMLFFCISGFVITQTLHNSKSSKDFAFKRFSRLFPTMLVCSILTYLISFIPPYTYDSNALNFLPSLTFIHPKIYNALFGTELFKWMDGAYWSLFVEVRFYILVAIIYIINKSRFYRNFLYLSMAIAIMFPLSIYFKIDKVRNLLNFVFIADAILWFVFGIGCFYLYLGYIQRAAAYFFVSVVGTILYVLAMTSQSDKNFNANVVLIASLIIFSFFLISMKVKFVTDLLSSKFLTSIGLASYSLYLLHQHIGEKIIVAINDVMSVNHIPFFVFTIVPFLVFLVFSFFALLLFKYYESPMNKILVTNFNHLSSKNRNDCPSKCTSKI